MLQRLIIVEKSLTDEEKYVSYHKDIVYSNVILEKGISNEVFTLEPIYIKKNINTYLLSYKYVAKKRGEIENTLNPLAHKEIVREILASLSLYFKCIFITDKNYLESILRVEASTVDDVEYPKKICPILFDSKSVLNDEIIRFNNWIKKLMELDNKKYNSINRSIIQFYNSILLINNSSELAYTSFVAIIESLTQKEDEYNSTWDDYYKPCKERLDDIFLEVDSNISDKIKNTLIKYSHNKLANRYLNFCLNMIDNDYFTEDAIGVNNPCKAREVRVAIINSYDLRSRYIHELEHFPKEFQWTYELETIGLFNNYYFTLSGMVRFVRYIIIKFIISKSYDNDKEEVVVDEEPGVFYVPMIECVHPNAWIHDSEMYSLKTSIKYLNGLLSIYEECFKKNQYILPNLISVCDEIEKQIKGINSNDKKYPLVIFYKLYNDFMKKEFRSENYDAFNNKYGSIIQDINIINLAYFLAGDINIPWQKDELLKLFKIYDKQFNHKNSIQLPVTYESILIIRLIELLNADEKEDYKYLLEKLIGINSGNEYLSTVYKEFIIENKLIKIEFEKILS